MEISLNGLSKIWGPLLSNTLMISPLGQGAYSPPGFDHTFVDEVNHVTIDKWNILAKELSNIYSLSDRFSSYHCPGAPARTRRKRILFLGCFDIAAGLGFEKHCAGEPYSNGIYSSFSVASALAERIRDYNDIELILRPHPFDTREYESLVHAFHNVVIDRYHSLDELVTDSDVVVGLGSTANIAAFIHGTPLITLAPCEFDGLDANIPCYDIDQFEQALDRALYDHKIIEFMKWRGRQIVVAMLSRHYYHYGHSRQIAKKHIRDFARWLIRFKNIGCHFW